MSDRRNRPYTPDYRGEAWFVGWQMRRDAYSPNPGRALVVKLFLFGLVAWSLVAARIYLGG